MNTTATTGALALSIYAFNTQPIRTVTEGDEVWFVAKDVFDGLGIVWKGGNSLLSIPDDWRGVRSFRTPQNNQHGSQGTTDQQLNVINFRAVTKIAFRSNKPEADSFTNWAADVIDSIRRTGQYHMPEPTPPLPAAELMTASDLRNLSRLIWLATGGMPHESAWTQGLWKHLRKVTRTPSPQRFRVEDIPLLVVELDRIISLRNRFTRLVSDASCEVAKRVFNRDHDSDVVIAEVEQKLKAETADRAARLLPLRTPWETRDLAKFTARDPVFGAEWARGEAA